MTVGQGGKQRAFVVGREKHRNLILSQPAGQGDLVPAGCPAILQQTEDHPRKGRGETGLARAIHKALPAGPGCCSEHLHEITSDPGSCPVAELSSVYCKADHARRCSWLTGLRALKTISQNPTYLHARTSNPRLSNSAFRPSRVKWVMC